MKYFISFFCIIISFSISGQRLTIKDSTNLSLQEAESLQSLLFNNKRYFENKSCPFEKVPLNIDAFFRDHVISEKHLSAIKNLENDDMIFETDLDFGFSNIALVLEIYFDLEGIHPPYQPPMIRPDIIKLDVINWEIYSDENLNFPLRKPILKNAGISKGRDYVSREKLIKPTITFKLNPEDHVLSTSNIQGEAEVDIYALSDFDQVELTKEVVGDTFKINTMEFVVVDIINDMIVYEVLGKNRDLFLTSGDVFGVNSDIAKENIFESTLENVELTTTYQTYKKKECINKGSASGTEFPVVVYEYFAANPNSTFEEFKEVYDLYSENYDLKSLEKTYKILRVDAPIEKFVLYSPVYTKLKTVKATIKETNNSFGHLMNGAEFEMNGNQSSITYKK